MPIYYAKIDADGYVTQTMFGPAEWQQVGTGIVEISEAEFSSIQTTDKQFRYVGGKFTQEERAISFESKKRAKVREIEELTGKAIAKVGGLHAVLGIMAAALAGSVKGYEQAVALNSLFSARQTALLAIEKAKTEKDLEAVEWLSE